MRRAEQNQPIGISRTGRESACRRGGARFTTATICCPFPSRVYRRRTVQLRPAEQQVSKQGGRKRSSVQAAPEPRLLPCASWPFLLFFLRRSCRALGLGHAALVAAQEQKTAIRANSWRSKAQISRSAPHDQRNATRPRARYDCRRPRQFHDAERPSINKKKALSQITGKDMRP